MTALATQASAKPKQRHVRELIEADQVGDLLRTAAAVARMAKVDA